MRRTSWARMAFLLAVIVQAGSSSAQDSALLRGLEAGRRQQEAQRMYQLERARIELLAREIAAREKFQRELLDRIDRERAVREEADREAQEIAQARAKLQRVATIHASVHPNVSLLTASAFPNPSVEDRLAESDVRPLPADVALQRLSHTAVSLRRFRSTVPSVSGR